MTSFELEDHRIGDCGSNQENEFENNENYGLENYSSGNCWKDQWIGLYRDITSKKRKRDKGGRSWDGV